ncbi:MAG: hypothetical protein QXJ51_02270 [Sulfolobales archaeon]
MKELSELRRVFSELERYIKRSGFSYYHALKLLDLLDREGAIGRSLASKYLKLGEGSSRNLMRKLRSLKLIEIDPVAGGIMLDRGRAIVEFWREIIFSSCSEGSDLIPWKYICVHSISKFAEETILRDYVRNVIALRDEIIRRGCSGALILRVIEGDPMLLNTRGEPDYSIKGTDLGSKVLRTCESFCIVTGSEKDMNEAEACMWNLIVDLINIMRSGVDS